MTLDDRMDIFTVASFCRQFENKVYSLIEQKTFKYPIYLSAGQEFIPATVAHVLKRHKPLIFAQHRAHSTYLSFDGHVEKLVLELLGKPDGCAGGMGGSASIQAKEINMFGHDGLMGSQVPIAVGACFSSNKMTIAIMGDAAAEEDYVMSSIAWAGTKNLPILFIVEDNNLSILTEKSVRRSWEMDEFARSVNVHGLNIGDDPKEIFDAVSHFKNTRLPTLLNIRTHRLYWHAGAGQDNYPHFDRLAREKEALGLFGLIAERENKNFIEKIWEKHLEK